MSDACFSGYLKDEKILRSSSGGFAAGLMDVALSRNAIVYGVSYADGYRSLIWKRITDSSQIASLQGSKYVKSPCRLENGQHVFASVAQDLQMSRHVFLVGLPCEVGALLHYLQKRGISSENLLTADLICQGAGRPELLNDYIEYLEKKNRSNIREFCLRFKNPDWKHSAVKAVFENRSVFLKPLVKTKFWRLSCLLPMPACFHCNFKGDRHCSDLTLGDHWGIQPEDETYHPAGVSLAIVHTSKGLSALYSMENAFIRKTDSEKALKHNPHYSLSVHMDREKQRVLRLYQKHGFLYAYYRRKTLAGIRESIARHTLRLFRKLQNHIKFK